MALHARNTESFGTYNLRELPGVLNINRGLSMRIPVQLCIRHRRLEACTALRTNE